MNVPTRVASRMLTLAATVALATAGCASASVAPGGAQPAASGQKAKSAPFCAAQQADPSGVAALTPQPNIKADLTFWGWYNIVPKAVMDDFHKVYPNINIKFVDFSTADIYEDSRPELSAEEFRQALDRMGAMSTGQSLPLDRSALV